MSRDIGSQYFRCDQLFEELELAGHHLGTKCVAATAREENGNSQETSTGPFRNSNRPKSDDHLVEIGIGVKLIPALPVVVCFLNIFAQEASMKIACSAKSLIQK